MSFSWNERKAAASRRKHGVSFEEAETCFDDPLGVDYEDPDPGLTERRAVRRAYSSRERLLVVVYAEHDGSVRIISARKATRSEAVQHAQGI
jgi:uncharacterized DUF497 family protein